MKDFNLINYINGEMVVNVHPNNTVVDKQNNLIQRIIKRIFTVQGSDAYNQNLGGQFNTLFKAVTIEEAEEAKNTFGILLNPIVDQLKEEQIEHINELDPSEILENIRLDSVAYDPVFGGFLINLTVPTRANSMFTLTI